jgi:hypothetical protein
MSISDSITRARLIKERERSYAWSESFLAFANIANKIALQAEHDFDSLPRSGDTYEKITSAIDRSNEWRRVFQEMARCCNKFHTLAERDVSDHIYAISRFDDDMTTHTASSTCVMDEDDNMYNKENKDIKDNKENEEKELKKNMDDQEIEFGKGV